MPKIQLASQRLNALKPTGQLNPSLLSSSAANKISAPRVSAPQISQNAANVQYTPMPVPKIQTDTLTAGLAGAANFADHAAKSAWEYQEREHSVYAQYANIGFQDEMRKLLEGQEDQQGNFTPGYLGTEGMVASEGYGKMN